MISKNKIKIGIIERNQVFRERLAEIIRLQKDMTVAFSIPVSEDHVKPADVILLEWRSSNDFLLRQKGNGDTNAKILVFDADLQDQGFVDYLRCGARGFILSSATEEEIVDAIRTIMKMGLAITLQVALRVCSEVTLWRIKQAKSGSMNSPITCRQSAIIRLIADGLTNKEIADKLNISVGTVKTHVHRILKKSGLQSRAHLAHNRYEDPQPFAQRSDLHSNITAVQDRAKSQNGC